MALFLSLFIVLCVSLDTVTGESMVNKSTTQHAVSQDYITSSSGLSKTQTPNIQGDGAEPTQTPDNGLTTLAFGVMSFILILIIVMVILVTAVNLRGQCNNKKENGVKNYGSVISEGQISNTGERDSIMLVSMRTINTDTDTDSQRISSIYSTALDNEDQ